MFDLYADIPAVVDACERALDPTTHETQGVHSLTMLFDAIVELREADDGSREGRVVGWSETPRIWREF